MASMPSTSAVIYAPCRRIKLEGVSMYRETLSTGPMQLSQAGYLNHVESVRSRSSEIKVIYCSSLFRKDRFDMLDW